MEDIVDQLVCAGFDRQAASEAVKSCSGENREDVINLAAAILLSGSRGAVEEAPKPGQNDTLKSKSKRKRAHNETPEGSRFRQCPICDKTFPLTRIESHVASCNGVEAKTTPAQVPKRKLVSATAPAQSVPGSPTNDVFSQMIANSKRINSMMAVTQPVSGLFIFENFLTEAEEDELVSNMMRETDPPFKVGQFNGIHYGKRWGVHCNLRDRKVGAAENPLPQYMTSLINPKIKALGHPKLSTFTMNEANAIEYRRDQGHNLDHHVDDRILSKEPICNLSLKGSCRMTYTRVQERVVKGLKGKDGGGVIGEKVKVLLKPRSESYIYIMTFPSTHSHIHSHTHSQRCKY